MTQKPKQKTDKIHSLNTTNDSDNPWKEAIEEFFPEFMSLLFLNVSNQIDWSKNWTFLDKELQKITKKSETGNRYVDKLVKAYLKNGDEKWFLIHIEIQGYEDKAFTKRMFEYFYRIYDRYQKDIVSMAVFTDINPKYHPKTHKIEFLDCINEFHFLTVKLIDLDREELENSKNPFSVIILSHLVSIQEKDPIKRKDFKLQSLRMLKKKGWTKDQIKSIFKFIDWLITLPEDLEIQYVEESNIIEKEESMPYITTAERVGYKRGWQSGMKNGILGMLELKFGTSCSPEIIDKAVDYAIKNSFDNLKELIKNANNIEEFKAGLDQGKAD